MAAIPMEELEKLEKKYGLEADDLSYQHRCSRITAYQKGEGESWAPPEKKNKPTQSAVETHPLYGKKILITPLMIPDAKRNLAFDEYLGPEMVVREVDAGERLYGQSEEVDRMVGDYEIVRRDTTRQVVAKTTFPKVGTEITYTIGRDLVPVVRGNDNKRGYIWSFPTRVVQVEDTLLQLYGLKQLITSVWPDLLPKFSGKPMMDYIDGITLAASIPQTHALLKEQRRKELLDARAGLI